MPDCPSRSPIARVAIVALALSLAPAAAFGDHFDGDPSSGTFDPRFAVTVPNALANQTSALTMSITQRDHEDPPILTEISIAGAWQFDTTLPALRPGQKADATPAARCEETIDGLDDDRNGNARFARAERIGTSRMLVHLDITRPGDPLRFDGHHAFLSWDGAQARARLCLLLTTQDVRIANLPPTVDVEGASELVAAYDLRKVGGAWRIDVDLRDIVRDETIQLLNTSLLEFTNTYAGASDANWNAHPAAVAKNPAAEGTYPVSARFTTCPSDGSYGSCRSNRGPVVREVPVAIRLPAGGKHPIPVLTSPAPFAVLLGTNTVPVRWEERRYAEQPVGYVVAIAAPGESNPDRIYRLRILNGPGSPCPGSGVCALSVSFPLVTSPNEEPLPADGRYSVGVVAIFGDGHRSDGRCDDGTPAGTTVGCTAAVTEAPGWAGAEFLLRAHAWPLRYQDRSTADVLLVDPTTKSFEYVVWLRNAPAQESYRAADGGMTSAADTGRFGFVSPDFRWSVAGAFAPAGAVAVVNRPTNTVFLPSVPLPLPLPLPRQIPVPGGATIQHPRPFVGTPV